MQLNPEKRTFVVTETASQFIHKLEAEDNIEIKYGFQEENNERVVMKCEIATSTAPRLPYEYRILKMLQSVNVPRLYYYGPFNETNALITQQLGPTLEELLNACGKKFTLKTVIQIAEQAIDRMEFLHSNNLVHRRISPQCFQFGLPGNSDATFMYLTDLGLAKEFKDKATNDHIPFKEQDMLLGIPRYMSIAAHHYKEQARRDDLESFGYLLVYMLKGRLPWQGLQMASLREQCNRILEIKKTINSEKLCENLPVLFKNYFEYVNLLDFVAVPKYKELKKAFTDTFQAHNFKRDDIYDWNA
ncbi:casein kinase I-like isoform gamma-3 isoform X9 [Leptotrombidium deliense]|uniref:Casein kinase I-like isoform gamma-3 isoform X9 n=1 Tax=Leptotrombidium deliense TaxID=299467 RepID=A0A443SN43_9ACAR|nr:casein kinase I-like isoform gamma-3 isoform X9 [Leptotrombidium deliense]